MFAMQVETSRRGNRMVGVRLSWACAAVVAALGSLGLQASAEAGVYTWSAGAVAGDWSANSNWGGSGHPAAGDTANINVNATVSLNGNQAAEAISVATGAAGGTLSILPTNAGDTLTLGATGISKSGNASLTFGNTTTASTLALSSSSSISSTATGGHITVYSAITGAGFDLTVTVPTGGQDVGLVNQASNTFRNLYINSGTVLYQSGHFTNNYAICAGDITVGDGTGAAGSAILNWQSTVTNSTLLQYKIVTVKSDGQLQVDTGQNTRIGTVNLDGGSIVSTGGARRLEPLALNVTANSYIGTPAGLDANSQLFPMQNTTFDVAASTTLTMNGVFGAGAAFTITKANAGTWIIANPNSAAGTTTTSLVVQQGTVQINGNSQGTANNNTLGNTNAVQLGNASTPGSTDAALIIGGVYTVSNPVTVTTGGTNSTRTIGGINASGTAVFAGGVTLGQNARLSAASGGKVQFTGVINDGAGSYALTTTGAGTIELTNANTYDGGTSVSSGTLLVSNSSGSATGSGLVTIAGGTLGGGGTISGTVRLDSGTLSPGTSAGRLTVGGMTLTGGTLAMDVNGTAEASSYDQIVTSGNVDLGAGTTSLSLASTGYTAGASDYIWLVNNTGSGTTTTGHFNGLLEGATFSLAGKTFAIHYNAQYGTTTMTGGNDVVLTTVIPEPTAGALMGSLTAALCVLGPRRHRR